MGTQEVEMTGLGTEVSWKVWPGKLKVGSFWVGGRSLDVEAWWAVFVLSGVIVG